MIYLKMSHDGIIYSNMQILYFAVVKKLDNFHINSINNLFCI